MDRAGRTRDVQIICCDDDYDEETFDRRFTEDSQRRSGGRLIRYGAVRPSVAAARGALTTAARHGEMPDVVLMDDWMRGPGGRPQPGAFELLRWIVSTFDEPERP